MFHCNTVKTVTVVRTISVLQYSLIVNRICKPKAKIMDATAWRKRKAQITSNTNDEYEKNLVVAETSFKEIYSN